MMKKLLILMLVLGMASTASAVLITSVQTYYFQMEMTVPTATIYVGDTVTIEIFAGDTVDVSAMTSTVLNISSATSCGIASITTPGDWSIVPTPTTTSDGSGGYNVNVDGTITTPISTDSSIYTVSFVANGAGTVTIDATAGTWTSYVAVTGPLDGFNDGSEGFEIYGLPYHQLTVVIPEPMTIALLGLGGLLLRRRKGGRRK